MYQIVNIPQTVSFEDREYASISDGESGLRHQKQSVLRSSATPLPRTYRPKFRKLFDRHKIAYRQ